MKRRDFLQGVAAGAVAAGAAAVPVASEALAAAEAPHPLAGLTLEQLIERYGEDEVMDALGFYRPTPASTEMLDATALLRAHMAAMDAIYGVQNMAFVSEAVDDKLNELTNWHGKQAEELVTKLRRMGYGDGSSTSVNRRCTLLRWVADFANDEEDLVILLQAEEDLHHRITLPEDHPCNQPNTAWEDDFAAGLKATLADMDARDRHVAAVREKYGRHRRFGRAA